MRKGFVVIEWLLLVVVIGGLILILLPFSDMFNFNRDLRDARKQGIYYPGSAERQMYYGSSLRVDGVIYESGELNVYMTATRLGPANRMPHRVRLQTDSGLILESNRSGSSNNAIRSKGYFSFKDVPEGLRTARFFYDSYGESFSFDIPLQSGGSR